jgi:hypothetical protein
VSDCFAPHIRSLGCLEYLVNAMEGHEHRISIPRVGRSNRSECTICFQKKFRDLTQ